MATILSKPYCDCSSLANLTLLAPFELVKNCTQTSVLMASKSNGSKAPKNAGRVSSYDAVRQITAERGLLGLYTGFRLHFLRDTLGSGIYFGVYEAVKQSLNSAYGASQVNAPGSVAFAGGVCGIVAWGVVSFLPCPCLHMFSDVFL